MSNIATLGFEFDSSKASSQVDAFIQKLDELSSKGQKGITLSVNKNSASGIKNISVHYC